MAAFAIKAASRTVLRRSYFPRHTPSKRYTSSDTAQPIRKITSKIEENPPTSETSIPVPSTIPPLPLWKRLGIISRVGQAYGRSQRKRPYTTQFCSSLVIYFIGDLSAQNINGDEYDPKRTLRALVISAGSSIPTYRWFIWLGNSFNYSSPILSLSTKVLVNQIVFAPVFNSYFFGMQSFLAGDSLSEVWERITRTVPTSIVNSWKLWPAVTAINFRFVDPQYRSIFAGLVAVGWQTYLSYLNRRAEVEENRERSGDVVEESEVKQEEKNNDVKGEIQA